MFFIDIPANWLMASLIVVEIDLVEPSDYLRY